MNAPTRVEAESALADAGTARAALAADGSWFRTYLLVFAAAAIPLLLLIGLDRQRGAMIATPLWLLLCSAMSWWAARQRVVLRGNKGRSFLAFGGWGVLYGAALVLGLELDVRRAAFWVPAALVTAVPLILAACWPTNRSEQSGPTRGPENAPIAPLR